MPCGFFYLLNKFRFVKKMQLKHFFILLFVLNTLQLSSQQQCDTFTLGRNNNDTSKLKVFKCVVYDTVAISLNGYLQDDVSGAIIKGAKIDVDYGDYKISYVSDERGEYNFWIMPQRESKLNIKITHDQCLVVNDLLHCGGQWIKFKLKRVTK